MVDVRGFFAALGVELPPDDDRLMNWTVACFFEGCSGDQGVASMTVSSTSGKFRCSACRIEGDALAAAAALGWEPDDAHRLAGRFDLGGDGG